LKIEDPFGLKIRLGLNIRPATAGFLGSGRWGIPHSPFRIPHFQVVAGRRGIPHSPFRIPHFQVPFHLPPLTIPLSYFPRQGMEDRGDSLMNAERKIVGTLRFPGHERIRG
jgi:hypothetical protein